MMESEAKRGLSQVKRPKSKLLILLVVTVWDHIKLYNIHIYIYIYIFFYIILPIERSYATYGPQELTEMKKYLSTLRITP